MSLPEDIFICKNTKCSRRINTPITLPCCGQTICSEHLNNWYLTDSKNMFKCQICKQEYEVTFNGFKVNYVIDLMLKQYHCEEQKLANELHNQLYININKLRHIHKEPNYYVNEYLRNLKNDIDINREEIKTTIDNHYDDLLKKISQFENDKRNKISKLDSTTFDRTIAKLEQSYLEFRKSLNRYISDNNSWIKLKNDIKSTNDLVLEEINILQSILFGGKSYEFQPGIVNIEQFGKLLELENEQASYILAVELNDESIELINLNNGKCISKINGDQLEVKTVLFLSQYLIAIVSESSIKIWDLRKDQLCKTLKYGYGHPIICATAVNETEFLIGTEYGLINLYNVNCDEPVRGYSGHEDCVTCIVMQSVDKFISSSIDNKIKIWDIQKSVCLGTLVGHVDEVDKIDLLSSTTQASCSSDGCIKIWDLNSYTCTQTFKNVSSNPIFSLKSDSKTDEIAFVSVINSKYVKDSRWIKVIDKNTGQSISSRHIGDGSKNLDLLLSADLILIKTENDQFELRKTKGLDLVRKLFIKKDVKSFVGLIKNKSYLS